MVKNRELQKINTDLDNFIYTASHDLKAPVANLEGLLYTLKEEMQEDENKYNSILEMIDSSILRFKNVIMDLTEVGRLQKENPLNEPVAAAEVFNEVMADLTSEIKLKEAHIATEFTISGTLQFSRKNFRSIIYNLLSNSLKYSSPERTPQIKVKMSEDLQQEMVVLEVADNGLGIPAHQLPKVFSMFKRFHDHVEGSGLGLYLVKRMMDNAGGKVEVLSEEGKGTTIRVYFKTSLK